MSIYVHIQCSKEISIIVSILPEQNGIYNLKKPMFNQVKGHSIFLVVINSYKNI